MRYEHDVAADVAQLWDHTVQRGTVGVGRVPAVTGLPPHERRVEHRALVRGDALQVIQVDVNRQTLSLGPLLQVAQEAAQVSALGLPVSLIGKCQPQPLTGAP